MFIFLYEELLMQKRKMISIFCDLSRFFFYASQRVVFKPFRSYSPMDYIFLSYCNDIPSNDVKMYSS